MRVLILDAVPEQASRLAHLLPTLNPVIEIVATLDSVEAGVRWFLSKPPVDLIFMDIQLPDGSSFDVLSEVRVSTPVIITCNSAQHALKAFQINCIDYLLKPVEKNALIAALYKFNKFQDLFGVQSQPGEDVAAGKGRNRLSGPIYKSRFVVHLGDKIRFVTADDIAYFKADGNLVYLYTFGSDILIIDHTLEEIADVLDPKRFFRINRTFILQISGMREIRRYFNSRLKLYLEPSLEEEVLVSRNRVSDFLTWLGS